MPPNQQVLRGWSNRRVDDQVSLPALMSLLMPATSVGSLQYSAYSNQLELQSVNKFKSIISSRCYLLVKMLVLEQRQASILTADLNMCLDFWTLVCM